MGDQNFFIEEDGMGYDEDTDKEQDIVFWNTISKVDQ